MTFRIDELFPATRVETAEGDVIERRPESFRVLLRAGRRQEVRYGLRDGVYRFESRVASAATLSRRGLSEDRLAADLLLRNRETPVVAFGFDADGGVAAWIHQRAETLQREELWFYVIELAHEADRLERLLTGEDRE